MFKKQTGIQIKKKSPHSLWDLYRYKTTNQFEGMIMKGWISVSCHRETEKDFINLIKLYKNDIYSFSLDGEISLDAMEIQENTIAFSSPSPLIKYAEVWVCISYSGISSLIMLSDKIPLIYSNEGYSHPRYQGTYIAPSHSGKYLRNIPFVDFKTTKFKRITPREKDSLLNKMKMLISKKNLKDLESIGNIDFRSVFENLDRKEYVLTPAKWDGETSSIIPIDFVLSLLDDPRTKISLKENVYNTILLNDQEVVISQRKPLNNKQAIELLMKGAKSGRDNQ